LKQSIDWFTGRRIALAFFPVVAINQIFPLTAGKNRYLLKHSKFNLHAAAGSTVCSVIGLL
jgi:hypothetical protein